MSHQVVVYKGRTNVIPVSLGIDVSADSISSQIRSEPRQDSPLLMDWAVSYVTDGSDGEILLTVDNTVTEQIKANSGFMDLKRVVAGEPRPVFDQPLEVEFRGTVTV